MFSLAEDLLLLLLDDESGRSVVDGTRRDYAVAGAVLVELARLGRVSPAEPGDDAKEGYAVVREGSPTGDPVLDALGPAILYALCAVLILAMSASVALLGPRTNAAQLESI